MAGALNAIADDVPEQAPDDSGADPAGALQLAQAQPNAYAKGMYATGERLLGDPSDPGGALNKFQGVPVAREKAAQDQIAGIRRAMRVLQATGASDRYNLPALSARAAFGQPTGSNNPGGAFANANQAYVDELRRQRAEEGDLANKLAGYETAIGTVPGALVNQQAGDYRNIITEGRQFENEAAGTQERADAADLAYRRSVDAARIGAAGRQGVADTNVAGRQGVADTNVTGRQTVAEIAAQSRRDAAEAYAGSRITVAQIGADKNRFVYEGTMPSNATIGVWTDKTTGEVKYGPAVAGKAGATTGQTMQIIQSLRQENPDLTFADALSLSKRAPPNASAEQLRKEGMALTAAKGDVGYFSDPEATWQAWRKRLGLSGVPFAPPTGSAPVAAPRPAAPAAAPAAPAAAVSPAPGPAAAAPAASAIPARPTGLPPGSAYNPARKQWRDPSGKIYDVAGRPVGG